MIDASIAQTFEVEIVADARAKCGDQRLDFIVAQDLIEAGSLRIQDLAAQRQDRLEVPVASLLGRAACRVTFHDVELRLGRVALGAVGQLTGQGQQLKRRLADDQVARLARRIPRAGGGEAFGNDRLGCLRIFFQEGTEAPRPPPA